jgi:hypothetical protein
MSACLASPAFSGAAPVTWSVPDAGPSRSKRVDNSTTRVRLGGWAPKYDSFESFMRVGGGVDYYTPAATVAAPSL